MKEKTNQGITLIALVVTIIILLILASISIGVILGDNGLIEMAIKAKDQYKEAEENDNKMFENLLEQIESQITSQTGTSVNGELTITMTTNTPQQGDEYKLSEKIVYEIVVENTGDVSITDIKVLEELTKKSWKIDDLEPEKSETYKVEHIVTEEDILKGKINNKATVTGTYIGTEETEIKAEVTIENKIEPPNAHLNILMVEESTPVGGVAYALGESITYSITVKNDGNLTITNIAVTDELTGDEWPIENLAPGANKEYTAQHVVTEADILAGSVVNVAKAGGQANGVDWVEVNPGESEVPTQCTDPSLFVRCTVSNSEKSYKLGETVNYNIEVINNGNATIKDITISDSLTGSEFSIESLEPNGRKEFTSQSQYTITEADILAGSVIGTCTATGTDPNGNEVDDFWDYTVLTEEKNSYLKVKVVPTSRPANGRRYELLETITYSIIVTNDGNLTLRDITVECELTGDAWTIEVLGPGASETYTAEYWVTEEDVSAGYVDNRVVVTATSPDPDNPEVGAEGSCTENLK